MAKNGDTTTIVNGHYDGQRVVLDEPVPQDVPADTPCKVYFAKNGRRNVLDRIADLAGPSDLPPDYSQQHDHYVKGTPRK
jgi:hypothetical protein